MTLADRLFAALANRGPLPARELAREVRRRKAVVIEALWSDPRFVHTGKTKASAWGIAPVPSLSIEEAALRWDVDVDVAAEFIFGEEGFLERGLVALLNGNGRVVVTRRGLEFAEAVESLR